jgi:hypothetical protein
MRFRGPRLSRRTFLKGAALSTFARPALALGPDLFDLKLTVLSTNASIEAVRFQFGNHDGSETFTIDLAIPDLEFDVDPEIRISGHLDTVDDEAAGESDRLRGRLTDAARPRIVVHDVPTPGPGRSRLAFQLFKARAVPDEPWRVAVESDFWRGSSTGTTFSLAFEDLLGPTPQALPVLTGDVPVWNVLSQNIVTHTVSWCSGIGIQASGTSRVSFGLPNSLPSQSRDVDQVQTILGQWSFRPHGGDGSSDAPRYRMAQGTVGCAAIALNSGPVEELPTWPSVTLLDQELLNGFHRQSRAAATLRAEPQGPRVRRTVHVVEERRSSGTVARVAVPIHRLRLSLFDRQQPVLETALGLPPSRDEDPSEPEGATLRSPVELSARRRNTGYPGATMIELSGPLQGVDIAPPWPEDGSASTALVFNSPGFGRIVTDDGDASNIRIRLDTGRIASFVLAAPIRSVGVILREETDNVLGVRSNLAWPDERQETIFRLRATPEPDISDDDAEAIEMQEQDPARDVALRRNAVLIDWRSDDPAPRNTPFDQAPLDIALDGAVLETRRSPDLLALDFRFHNMRLLADGSGGRMRMAPRVGPLRIDTVGDAPDRPILTMEVPGRHVLKESQQVQLITASDLPQADLEALLAQSVGQSSGSASPDHTVTDLTQLDIRTLFAELRVSPVERRVVLRREINARMERSLAGGNSPRQKDVEFRDFSTAFRNGAANASTRRGRVIPPDQHIYVGPDHMDRDLWEIARQVILQVEVGPPDPRPRETLGSLRAADRISAVENNPELLRARRLAYGVDQPELANDPRYPANVELPEESGGTIPFSLEKEQSLDALRRGLDPFYRDFSTYYFGATRPNQVFPGVSWYRTVRDAGTHPSLINQMQDALQAFAEQGQRFKSIYRSRFGGRSRLCFFWDSRDTPTEDTAFALAALLERDNADLSVPLRARRVFRIDETDGKRRPVFEAEAVLEAQGIRGSDSGRTSIERMAEVYRNAATGIAPWETSLELLSRIEFSIPQDAALTTRRPAPKEVFTPSEDAGSAGVPNWSIDLDPTTRGGGLRAIASPDFNPAVFLSYLRQTDFAHGDGDLTPEQLDMHYDAPSRGAEAPWARPRIRLDTDERPFLDQSGAVEPPFQTALSAYQRHALVATSVAGRPGAGEVSPLDDSELIAEAEVSEDVPIGSFPAPASHRLIDLLDESDALAQAGYRGTQSILEQQDIGFTEVSLQTFGPSVSIDAPFQPKAAALDNLRRRLFDATPIEQFSYESTFGEDELTRILEKGYLFPLGHKATRVTQTTTVLVSPGQFTPPGSRKYPAAVEITRTWITVSEPVKTRWFGQAFEGRERPFSRSEIITLRTPDLVSPDATPTIAAPGVEETGRLSLGRGAKGVAFWPRLARDEAATFKFEVIFDDGPAAVEVPLMFVDFTAATDAETMRRIALYYNGIPCGTDEIDPASLRTVAHAGARRRYAQELRDGDSTYETRYWVLGAEGRPETSESSDGLADIDAGDFTEGLKHARDREALFGNPNTEFTFGALLSASDQPPFYPFLQAAEIQCDRIARQTGARRGPTLQTTFDLSYLQPECFGFAANSEGIPIPGENASDLVLGVRNPKALDVGNRGDRVGAIGRPAGFVTAIARREGPMLYGQQLTCNAPTVASLLPSHLHNLFSTTIQNGCITAGPNMMCEREDLGLPENLTSASLRPSKRIFAQPFSDQTLSGVLCQILGAEDMKILGIIKVCDFIKVLVAASGIENNIPKIDEITSLGEGFLADGIEAVRERVIGRLLELTVDVQTRFDTAVRSANVTVPGLDIFPDVKRALEQFRVALQAAQEETEPVVFIDKTSAVISAGKTLVRTLENVAKDPIGPVRDGLVELLTEQIFGGEGDLGRTFRSFLEGDDYDIAELLATAGADPQKRLVDAARVTVKNWITEELDWRVLATGAFGALQIDDPSGEIPAFFENAADEAVETAFTDGNQADLTTFEAIITGLDPRGAKWVAFARHQVDAFVALAEQLGTPAQWEAAGLSTVRDLALQIKSQADDLAAAIDTARAEADALAATLILLAAQVESEVQTIQDRLRPAFDRVLAAQSLLQSEIQIAANGELNALPRVRAAADRLERELGELQSALVATDLPIEPADYFAFLRPLGTVVTTIRTAAETLELLEARLKAMRDRLILRVFGVQYADLERGVVAGANAARAIQNFADTPISQILSELGRFVEVIDEVFAVGGYAAFLNPEAIQDQFEGAADEALRKARQRLQPLVRPIGEALCLVDDYLDLFIDGLTAPPLGRLPTRDQLRAKFAAAKTAPGDVSDLIDELNKLEFDLEGWFTGQLNPVREVGRCIQSLAVLAERVGDAIDELANDTALSLQQALVAILEWQLAFHHQTLARLEDFALAFNDLLRLQSAVADWNCPDDITAVSVDELVETLSDFGETHRGNIEAYLTLRADVVVTATALVRHLSDRLSAQAAAETNALVESLETQIAAAVALPQDALARQIPSTLTSAEEELCICAFEALGPILRYLLGSAEQALDGLDAGIRANKPEILDRLTATLNSLGTAVEELDGRATETIGTLGLDLSGVFGPIRDKIASVEGTLNRVAVCDTSDAVRLVREVLAGINSVRRSTTKEDVAQYADRIAALPDQIAEILTCGLAPDTPANAIAVGARGIEDQIRDGVSAQMNALSQALKVLEGQAAESAKSAVQALRTRLENEIWAFLLPAIQGVAGPINSLYGQGVGARNRLVQRLDTDALAPIQQVFPNIGSPQLLFVAIDRRGMSRDQIRNEKASIVQAATEAANAGQEFFLRDKLQDELVLLTDLAVDSGENQFGKLRDIYRIYSGRSYRPGPLQILETVNQSISDLTRAVYSLDLDIADVRNLIEDELLAILPTKQTTTMNYDLALSEIGGIFVPLGPKRFSISATTSIDLLNPLDFTVSTRAVLSEFEIRLFGDAYDVFTLVFSNAVFEYKSGEEPSFAVTFSDYRIGKMAEFLQELQSQLGQGAGGVYIEPAVGLPGLVVGYRLALPAIGLGAVTFLNVGLTAAAILPFDNREAFFSVGISTRRSPFIILVGLWGGGGHFTLYTNGLRMLGCDASFVFAGGGAISAGLLELQGRVSVGVFVRKVADVSEISGDFFAGGSGRIAMFGVSSALTVRTGQDGGGNMVGSAVFSFSFSLGLAKVSFAITLFKKEGKGFREAGSEQRSGRLRYGNPVQVAAAGAFDVVSDALHPIAAHLVGEDDQDDPARFVPGEGDIIIEVTRFERDYQAWRENFASLDSNDIFADCRGA